MTAKRISQFGWFSLKYEENREIFINLNQVCHYQVDWIADSRSQAGEIPGSIEIVTAAGGTFSVSGPSAKELYHALSSATGMITVEGGFSHK